MFVCRSECRQSNLKLVKFHCLCMLTGSTNVCINENIKGIFCTQQHIEVSRDHKESSCLFSSLNRNLSRRLGCTAALVNIYSETSTQRRLHSAIIKVPQQRLPTLQYFDLPPLSIYRHLRYIATPDISPQSAMNDQWRYTGF